MKRRRIEVAVTAVVSALAGALGFMWLGGHPQAAIHPPVAPTHSSGIADAIAGVPAEMRSLEHQLNVVGSVAYDQDHYAIVGPLVPGRIVMLRASLGAHVSAGQVLAEIESPAVAQARANYITARARAEVARTNAKRESELADKNISSARERELAQAQATQDDSSLWAAEESLRALGVDAKHVDDASQRGRVNLVSPIEGTVVKRDVALGEAVEHGTDAFVVANLNKLWVKLDIYERDLQHVRIGQKVTLGTESLPGVTLTGSVSYVDMSVDTETRTAHVRVVFDNHDNVLRAGQFVTARLLDDGVALSSTVLCVPRAAIQSVQGKTVVFVLSNGDYAVRDVKTGQSNEEFVEIASGLQSGEVVATKGTFLLKSKLMK